MSPFWSGSAWSIIGTKITIHMKGRQCLPYLAIFQSLKKVRGSINCWYFRKLCPGPLENNLALVLTVLLPSGNVYDENK